MIWLWLILATALAAPVVAERRRRVMDDAARGSATGQFAILSHGVTHFEWFGPVRGPVVVCVHGLTTPSFVWRGMARALAQSGYRVLTYDLYGRGFSDRPKGPQDRAFFVDQLAELLAHEGIGGNLTLVGYSMGGAISTCFAAAHPDRMHRLILLAPAGMGMTTGGLTRFIKGVPVIGDWLMLALYPAVLRRGLKAEQGQPTSVPRITDLQRNELAYRRFIPSVLASLRGILSDDLSRDHRALAERGLPVLAIWGREDRVIPMSAMGQLAAWNRDAQQEVIDTAGHGLTYTHTDAVLRIIHGWMPQPA